MAGPTLTMHRMKTCHLVALLLVGFTIRAQAAGEANREPHIVFAVGTTHYGPQVSMPALAKEMEKFGFRTTVVLPEGDPEHQEKVAWKPGIEVLDEADVVVFFMRFLSVGDAQFAPIERYVKSGKPIVAFRTSTHAFDYPKGHPRFSWNDDFGEKVLGTAYSFHMAGTTECAIWPAAAKHPILAGVGPEPFVSAGSLYLTELEAGCAALVIGTGMGKAGVKADQFGTFYSQESEKDIVAWAWTNGFGARVFSTSFGHVRDFAVPQIMRIVVNGIHWAAGKPQPAPDVGIGTLQLEDPHEKR